MGLTLRGHGLPSSCFRDILSSIFFFTIRQVHGFGLFSPISLSFFVPLSCKTIDQDLSSFWLRLCVPHCEAVRPRQVLGMCPTQEVNCMTPDDP